MIRDINGPHHPADLEVRFSGLDSGTAPLAWGQQRVLHLMDALSPHHATLNLRFVYRLRPRVPIDEVVVALARLLRHCESLRTIYHLRKIPPHQEIVGEGVLPLRLVRTDTATAVDIADELACEPFGEGDLPLRAAVVTNGDGVGHLAFAVHHLSADFLSIGHADLILRDVLARDFGEAREVATAQPRDVVAWEGSATGRTTADQALRRHADVLRTMPQSMLPRLPRAALEPRYRYLELASPLAGAVVAHLACRHQVTETAVSQAVLAAVLAGASGLDRSHLQLCVSNRADPRFATMVGSLTQDVPTCTDVTGVPFSRAVRASASVVLSAVRTGRFPPRELAALRHGIERERGLALDLSFWLNSRIPALPRDVERPSSGELKELSARSSLRWTGGDPTSTSTLFIYLDRYHDELRIRMLVDTAYVEQPEACAWLACFEAMVLEALAHPDRPMDELARDAGVEPARRGDEWAFVDHSWIHLPTVADRVSRTLGAVPVHVEVRGTGSATRLVTRLDGDGDVDRRRLATMDVETIRDSKVAMVVHPLETTPGMRPAGLRAL